MEYVPLSFYNVILAIGNKNEDIARFFARQIADAVVHMHGKNVAHLDLKPENIMVDQDLNIKIGDFGFATQQN